MQMQAYQIVTGKETLEPVMLPIPEPQSEEVLVKVAYAGLNRADLFQLQGKYPLPVETNMIPGLEISGTIEAIGSSVKDWNVGEEVCAIITGGGYAEYCLVPVGQVLPKPLNATLKESAALPEAFATVWLALFETARLQKEETVLIHGGSSGIGTAGIQLAKTLDARVIVTAGTKEKCEACDKLGAEAINYREEDFVSIVKEMTEGKGVDVVLDMVGGTYIEKNLRCLGTHGRLITISFLEGAKVEVNLAGLLMKNITWYGITLRSRPLEAKAYLMQQLKLHVWPLIEQKMIYPVIDTVFPFSQVEIARQHMQESLHIGKILLDMNTKE